MACIPRDYGGQDLLQKTRREEDKRDRMGCFAPKTSPTGTSDGRAGGLSPRTCYHQNERPCYRLMMLVLIYQRGLINLDKIVGQFRG